MTPQRTCRNTDLNTLDSYSNASKFLRETDQLNIPSDRLSANHSQFSSTALTEKSQPFNHCQHWLKRVFSNAEIVSDANDLLDQAWDRNGIAPSNRPTAGTFDSSSTALAIDLDPSGSLLSPTSTPNLLAVNTEMLAGSLRADHFTPSSTALRTVISGNGNVDFGDGYRDWINLSSISSTAVQVNLAGMGANTGVAFDPGNGTRIFDAINFNDGRQILFENIDTIQFSDRVLNLSVTPNDPYFEYQWNLHMMGVHNAWRFTTGTNQVLIGIQDTGLSINNDGYIHADLRYTNWLGVQAIDDTWNNHGTMVQGVIAAASNNGFGMSGINWNSRVFSVDVLGNEPGDLSLADASQSMINEARQAGERLVINMSLGVPESFGVNYHAALERVVQDNPDVLFVIAAGNNGNLGYSGISSPAILASTHTNVIAVGASWGASDYYGYSTTPGTRIEYDNWWGSQYGAGLTLMGPSEVIAPTSYIDSYGIVRFDFEAQFNGTSAATPDVTGVASLVLSANPLLSAGQVKQILSQTAVDLGAPGYDRMTGSGFVNADAAVRRAIALARGLA